MGDGLTLIQSAIPKINIYNLKDIKFINDKGEYIDDIAVYESNLSQRLKNILLENGIFLLSRSLFINDAYIRGMHGMGRLVYNELTEFIIKNTILIYNGKEKNIINKLKIFNKSIMDNKDNFKSRIIDIIFPKEKIGQNTEFYILSDYNELSKDIDLTKAILSVRTKNCLISYFENKSDIKLKDLLYSDFKELKHIHNMGEKSINEILNYLKTHVIFKNQKANKIDSIRLSNIKREVETKLTDNSINFPYDYLFNILLNELDNIDDKSSIIISRFIEHFLKSKNALNFHADYIVKLINENSNDIKQIYITKNQLLTLLPLYFKKYHLIDNILDKLINDRHILCINGKFSIWKPNINDWLSTLKPKERELISLRLQGKTLEEIGKEFSITRERVRQIIAKSLKSKPLLQEDKYRYWYEAYDLSYQDMKDVFDISYQTYAYLKLFYKHGNMTIFDLETEENLTYETYKNVKKMYKRYGIYIDGELILLKRADILNTLIKKYCKNQIKLEKLYTFYYEFLCKHNLESNDKFLFPSNRAFEARIEDSRNLLCSLKKCVRYYPLHEYDVQDFVNTLHLENYKNVEISSLLLFRENKELMEEYDIRDEYELHNYLKKTQEEWNENNKYEIEFKRMPTIIFGNADKEKQAREFLKLIAPVSLDDYGKYYEIEYGVLKVTACANLFKYLKEFNHNNMLQIDQPVLSSDEFNRLKELLVEDFYYTEDIIRMVTQYNIINDLNKINSRTLQNLGFKIYTNYIIRDTYSSSQDYFMKNILNDNVIDLNKQDSRLFNTSAFTTYVYDLRSQYNIIEIQDKIYVKSDYFLQTVVDSTITLEDLDTFVNHVIQYAITEKCFTLKSLIDKGFEDKLLTQPIPIYTLVSLVKNSYKVKYIKFKNNVLFYNENIVGMDKINMVDFYRIILNDKKKMYIYDFIDYVKKIYDIQLEKTSIMERIRYTEIYYDTIMEKIYLNKEEYYKDIEE